MKKTFLLFAVLFFIFTGAKAQLDENFDAVADGALPTGWTRFNVDGLTPYSGVNWVTDAWVCYAKTTLQITSKCAWSTSYYTPAGTSDDWMFTGAVTVPTGNAVLRYLVVAQDPSYPDGYELRIMTTAPTSSNLTTSTILYSEASGPSTPTTRTVSLSAYAGQTVYIGWRNHSVDMFLLGIDDVKILVLQDNNAAIASIDNPSIIAAGNNNIIGTITNEGGNAITSLNITYKIDGGTASAVYSPTGLNIPVGGSYSFTHNVPYNFTAGAHTIEVTIGSVNGATDPDLTNNVLSKTVGVASQTVAKTPLIEGFSSSTCSPCASWNPTFLTWANAHPNVNYIKYQVNWPGTGDPYYFAQTGDRVTYYNVSAVPQSIGDGVEISNSTSALDAVVTAANANPTPFTISMTPTYSGKVVTIPVTINPYITVPGLKVRVVVCEKTTTGNVGSNGETSFHHVMMQMLPDAAGTTVSFTDGTAYTNTFTKDMTSTFVEEMGDLMAVVLIQDDATKTVLQSKIVDFPAGISSTDLEKVAIYPNPVSSKLNILNAEDAVVSVYDVYGKIIKSATSFDSKLVIDLSDVAEGNYIVRIVSGENSITRKISVIK